MNVLRTIIESVIEELYERGVDEEIVKLVESILRLMAMDVGE